MDGQLLKTGLLHSKAKINPVSTTHRTTADNRILVETTPTETVSYLYGRNCLGEQRDDTWLYYLHDGTGHVRQGADANGAVSGAWLFDPDGTVLAGPDGPVSHLICSHRIGIAPANPKRRDAEVQPFPEIFSRAAIAVP